MGRGSRVATLVVVIFFAVLPLAIIGRDSARAAATPEPIGARSGRQQFGLARSGSTAVWEDRAVEARPGDLAARGSSDIRGFNFATNQSLVISTAPGDQTEPAISGSLVAWQDTGHSCPTCEADILAKDLATGVDYAVATGPADQAHPAVAGRTVIWIENDSGQERLLGTEVGGQNTFMITSVSSPTTTIGRPVASNDLIVWIELGPQALYTLKTYDLTSKQITTLAVSNWIGTQYAVDSRTVVWTDPRLWMEDLTTGKSSILDPGAAAAPQITGDTIVWSGTSVGATTEYDLYGLRIPGGQRSTLVVAPGNQLNPIVAGDRLVWQTDEAGPEGLRTLPLAQAFGAGTGQPSSQQSIGSPAVAVAPEQPTSSTASYTRPTYKGMHTANGGGWNITYNGTQQPCNNVACPAIDALGAPVEPFFGSFLVINYDLSRQTGRGSPWGPTVADAMKYVQNTYGSRVIIRTYPTLYPNPSGTTTPDNVAQQVVSLAQSYDWIKHVQIENEPNLNEGWPDSCSSCTWVTGGQRRTYTWTSMYDYRKYQAINDFYSDAWWSINWYQNNYSDPTVRARLQQMQFWTPPMADFYRTLDNGLNFYAYLHGMISTYGRMTYHTYPAPNYDSDGAGGIINNSWPWFDSWMQTNINNGSVRSMITEFGWNPGQMQICNLHQYDSWPASGAGSCSANDGRTHTFDNDIGRFLAYQRHNAEVVAVWIIKGWDDRADGIDPYGNVRTWLHNYQWSSP